MLRAIVIDPEICRPPAAIPLFKECPRAGNRPVVIGDGVSEKNEIAIPLLGPRDVFVMALHPVGVVAANRRRRRGGIVSGGAVGPRPDAGIGAIDRPVVKLPVLLDAPISIECAARGMIG